MFRQGGGARRGLGWRHSLRSLESGTVLFEAKDGGWRALGEGEVMEVDNEE